jgi:hypothetical protein
MEPFLIAMTFLSLALAALMSLVAWSLLREKRDRTAARVEALTAMAFESVAASGARDDAEIEPELADLPWKDRVDARIDAAPPEPLFEAPAGTGAGGRRFLALAAVVLVAVAGVATAYALRTPELVAAVAASHEAVRDSNPATESEAGPSTSSGPAPLELLSLRHDVGRDGSFTVTGLAQNPSRGRPLSDVVAVVYLFDGRDQYLTTGRALLGVGRLDPGEEAPFVIAVPGASGVSRYRVGFRHEDGGVVAHVDHRGQPLEGTTGAATDEPSGPAAPSPASTPRRSEG